MISETERVDELGYNSIRISFNAILLFVLFFYVYHSHWSLGLVNVSACKNHVQNW